MNTASDFRTCVLRTAVLLGAFLIAGSQATAQTPEFDRFGGCKTIVGQATGRWHIQDINGRDWFVTPEGYGFYVIGVNHIGEPGSEEARKKTVENLRNWGFNTAGYDAPDWISDQMPHFVNVTLHKAIHWVPADRFEFVDVFTDEFAEQVDAAIREACQSSGQNPLVIGYSLTDTPCYNLDTARRRRGSDWVSAIRSLGADTAGKRRYVEFLRERHNDDISRFKSAYRLDDVESFDDLPSYRFAGLELTRTSVRRDDEAFLAAIAERIYKLAREAFDRYDAGAILLGENFKMHDHTDAVLKVAAHYSDVISIQPGPTQGPDVGQGPDELEFNRAYWRHIHEVTGKPLFICDHTCSFATTSFPRTLWHQFLSEAEAAHHYDAYLSNVATDPHIIGYQRCQYRSRYDDLRTMLKQGLLDIDGRPYSTLVDQMRRTNQEVYSSVYRAN